MRLKTVPARQGLLWVRAGLRVFGRQPLGFASLFALFGLAVFLLLQIPLVGALLSLALMPLLTMSFMLGTRAVLQGQAPHPGLALPLLRDAGQRRRLVQLGAAYAAGTVAVVLVSQLLAGGPFSADAAVMADRSGGAEGALQDPALAWALLLRAALFLPLSLLFWHTPALMCWGRLPMAKALFANVVACWRSLGALAVFGLCWGALILVFTALVQTLFALLGLSDVVAQAIVPMALLASTAFYASLYFSFVDTFDLEDLAEPPATRADDSPPA